MPSKDNRRRVFVAVLDRAQRYKLERAGFVIESGTLQGYWMRQDYPAGISPGP